MRRVLEGLRSLLIWGFALPVFAVCCLFILLVALVDRGPRLERLIKACCRFVLFLCGVRVRVAGRENVVPGRAYILMMNHVNFLDPLVLRAAFPGPARGIEEESHFRWPLYGAMLRKIGMIPVDRKNPQRAKASLARAAELIRGRAGYSLAVLPEGTRTPDGRLGPFKRGGFLLALESGLEILPAVQVGAYRINRKGSCLIRPGRVDMFFEPPVSAAGYTRETAGDLTDCVRRVFLRRVA
jgi:1-acyl-sn-glycerol-3-phosphate acyltransferase